MYGAIAIVGGVEVVATIAILPAIINSFLFLTSVKRIVEHREVKARPTILMDDYRLMSSKELGAPVTLLRLVLANGPGTAWAMLKTLPAVTIAPTSIAAATDASIIVCLLFIEFNQYRHVNKRVLHEPLILYSCYRWNCTS
jgi:UDP-N-acetylglucosamine--dolichyl-phosphate N-acetylglucosaminephosphotransferase